MEERTQSAGPGGHDLLQAGGGVGEGDGLSTQPELTERPEVKRLLAEMDHELAPGEDPLYYDWTAQEGPPAEPTDRDYVTAKPARARHITIDAQKVKIADAARNPARTAKTARLRRGQPMDAAAIAAAESLALAGSLEAAQLAAQQDALPSDPPPAATTGSEPPASVAQDGADGWHRRGQEIADEISQDDLPSAHLPSLQATSTSERPRPSSVPPADAEQRRGRGWILVASLLALGCIAVLWWLSRSPVDDESSAPESVTVPVAPGDDSLLPSPAPPPDDSSEVAAEATAAPDPTSDSPAPTNAPAPSHNVAAPAPPPKATATRPRMID